MGNRNLELQMSVEVLSSHPFIEKKTEASKERKRCIHLYKSLVEQVGTHRKKIEPIEMICSGSPW